MSIYAVNNGYMDKVDRKKVVDFEAALQASRRSNHGAALKAINDKPVLKEHEATLKKIVEDFVATGSLLRTRSMAGAKEIRQKIGEHQEHSEDHQGDADGGCEQDAPCAGPHARFAPVRAENARGDRPPATRPIPTTAIRSWSSAR